MCGSDPDSWKLFRIFGCETWKSETETLAGGGEYEKNLPAQLRKNCSQMHEAKNNGKNFWFSSRAARNDKSNKNLLNSFVCVFRFNFKNSISIWVRRKRAGGKTSRSGTTGREFEGLNVFYEGKWRQIDLFENCSEQSAFYLKWISRWMIHWLSSAFDSFRRALMESISTVTRCRVGLLWQLFDAWRTLASSWWWRKLWIEVKLLTFINVSEV